MKQCADLVSLEASLSKAWRKGLSVGFVPTMGNLHEGHLSLIRLARARTDFTVVSIFVNPFQFGQGEDFDAYPRTLDEDLAKLSALNTDLVFLPEVQSLYPRGLEQTTRVEVPELGRILCGESRPQFFTGVCTVVNILLNLVRPDVAYFGEKDYQQLLIIRRMVDDLRIGTLIESAPTIREADGLAMSSRNNYLSSRERAQAPALYRALGEIRQLILDGRTDYRYLTDEASGRLDAAGLRTDYLAVRRAGDLREPGDADRHLRILGAGWLGGTRLIDNVAVDN